MKLIQLLKELEINKPLPNFPSDVRWYCIIKDKDTLVRILDYLGKNKWAFAGGDIDNNTIEYIKSLYDLGIEQIYIFGNVNIIFYRTDNDKKPDLSQFKQIKI